MCKSHFCFIIFTSSDKILVKVGVSHSFSLEVSVGPTVDSIVGSPVGSAFGLAVESIGSEVTVPQIRR